MKFYHEKLEKVKLGVEVRRSSANTQRFTNRPHELINNLFGCRYGFGRHFLIGLFETVGEAAISSALREVYLRILAAPDPTEGEVYRTFLKYVPPSLEEEFPDLYRRLHGGPFVDAEN